MLFSKDDIKVIAWDLDGTLYPTTPELNHSIEQQLIATLAKQLRMTLAAATAYYIHWKQQLKSSTKVLNHAGIDGQQFFIDLWDKLPLESHILPNPTLSQLFAQATRYRHVLHTNSNTLTSVQRKLACLGLELSAFTSIITLPWQGYQKPDRPAFELLLNQTAVPAAQILYVGDRLEVDLLPAHQLGLKTVLVGGELPPAAAWLDGVAANPVEVLQDLL